MAASFASASSTHAVTQNKCDLHTVAHIMRYFYISGVTVRRVKFVLRL